MRLYYVLIRTHTKQKNGLEQIELLQKNIEQIEQWAKDKRQIKYELTTRAARPDQTTREKRKSNKLKYIIKDSFIIKGN